MTTCGKKVHPALPQAVPAKAPSRLAVLTGSGLRFPPPPGWRERLGDDVF